MQKRIRLNVIPEPQPNTRTILAPQNGPAIRGGGEIDFICGNCESLLAEGISEDQIRNIVFKCSNCGQYNESPE